MSRDTAKDSDTNTKTDEQNATQLNATEQAKEMEKQIDASQVHVRTPKEVVKNKKNADKENRAAVVEQTNRGLRNDTRPGGDDGNGKTYTDERIVPSDTNAPDAGRLPDGTQVAS